MSFFSETLKTLRKRNNMPAEVICEKLGISKTHLERLETGYLTPDDSIVHAVAELFDVSEFYLKGSAAVPLIVSEPGYGHVANKYLSVPVVKMHSGAKAVVRESDIIDHIILPMPKDRDADFIGIMIDSDDIDCPRVMRGDIAIVMITNKLLGGEWVAVSEGGGPVFFRKYSRMGPTVILASAKNKKMITYEIGDGKYNIIGKIIGFQGSL